MRRILFFAISMIIGGTFANAQTLTQEASTNVNSYLKFIGDTIIFNSPSSSLILDNLMLETPDTTWYKIRRKPKPQDYFVKQHYKSVVTDYNGVKLERKTTPVDSIARASFAVLNITSINDTLCFLLKDIDSKTIVKWNIRTSNLKLFFNSDFKNPQRLKLYPELISLLTIREINSRCFEKKLYARHINNEWLECVFIDVKLNRGNNNIRVDFTIQERGIVKTYDINGIMPKLYTYEECVAEVNSSKNFAVRISNEILEPKIYKKPEYDSTKNIQNVRLDALIGEEIYFLPNENCGSYGLKLKTNGKVTDSEQTISGQKFKVLEQPNSKTLILENTNSKTIVTWEVWTPINKREILTPYPPIIITKYFEYLKSKYIGYKYFFSNSFLESYKYMSSYERNKLTNINTQGKQIIPKYGEEWECIDIILVKVYHGQIPKLLLQNKKGDLLAANYPNYDYEGYEDYVSRKSNFLVTYISSISEKEADLIDYKTFVLNDRKLKANIQQRQIADEKRKQEYEKLQVELAEERRQNHLSNVSRYGNEIANLISQGEVKIGMTKEMCRKAWGYPSSVNKTTNAYGTKEQWVYSSRRYLYFDGDILTTIQN